MTETTYRTFIREHFWTRCLGISRRIGFIVLCLSIGLAAEQPQPRQAAAASLSRVCAACIRAHLNFLASDALRGRGSATPDERVAATYIASELEQYGVEPSGDKGQYLEAVPVIRRKISKAPQLQFTLPGASAPVEWTHGGDIVVMQVGRGSASGPLQKVEVGAGNAVQKDAFVLLSASPGQPALTRADAEKVAGQGAAVVMMAETARLRARWKDAEQALFSEKVEAASAQGDAADKAGIVVLSKSAFEQMLALADGLEIRLDAPEDAPQKTFTYNVIGKIKGTNPAPSAIVFGAHLDHLGVASEADGTFYSGADDDASGVAAVLELARVLGRGPKPKRTVLFALFGSEELGGLGSTYFAEHPPVPLSQIAAELEFEMIGRPDPAVPADTLWLTGWPRSNLGPTLKAHGAKLTGDPHPEQNFFRRSDNYWLAERGVVAETISSYGLHADYHQVTDKVDKIDFKHMDRAIGSLLGPLQWLVNASFRPKWNPGGQP